MMVFLPLKLRALFLEHWEVIQRILQLSGEGGKKQPVSSVAAKKTLQ